MNSYLRNSKMELRLLLHAAVLISSTLLALEFCHRLRGEAFLIRLVDGSYVSFQSLECLITVFALHMVFAHRLAALRTLPALLSVACASTAATVTFFHAARIFTRL